MQWQIDEDGYWAGTLGKILMGCVCGPEDLPPGLEIRELKQVHGNRILDDASYQSQDQEGDGLVSDLPGCCLVIRTADCVPVHLTDGERIMMVHAGWRGTKGGIVKKAAAHLDPSRATAVIGPAICGDHYEVGPDLYQAWQSEEPTLSAFLKPARTAPDKRLFDLRGFIRAQLHSLGFGEARVTVIPRCTFAGPLPSYRRQGEAAARIYNYICRQA